MPSPDQDDRRVVASLLVLTFATGLIDAASVLGLGRVFTANMTGNVVFLGSRSASPRLARRWAAIFAMLAGGLVGAVCSAGVGPAMNPPPARDPWSESPAVWKAANARPHL